MKASRRIDLALKAMAHENLTLEDASKRYGVYSEWVKLALAGWVNPVSGDWLAGFLAAEEWYSRAQ